MQQTSFVDFDEYAQSIRDADVRCTMPNLEVPVWTICSLDSGSLHLQAGLEGSGNFAEGAGRRDGMAFYMQFTGTDPRVNGRRLNRRQLLALGVGGEFCIAADDAHNWASVFLPATVLSKRNISASNQRLTRIIESPEVVRLKGVVERIFSPVQLKSETFAQPAARQAADSQLLDVCSRMLAGCEPAPDAKDRPPVRSREEIISHAIALIDGSGEETPRVHVPTIAVAVGVSERTLRNVFRECFGVSPSRFIEVRKLNRARRLLKERLRKGLTIAQIAGMLGMWDFGRFASRYRRLFGELPSQTASS